MNKGTIGIKQNSILLAEMAYTNLKVNLVERPAAQNTEASLNRVCSL
jgi:hypothetical protein